jgi:predicted PhzF superfamily epimerase YddE/YHI9
MRVPYYHIDAFTSALFRGNPAGVCLIERWPSDEVLQQIAAENNLSETAFLSTNTEPYGLRWFTPEVEVDLCGHATLAPAWLLFREIGHRAEVIRFKTRSGILEARNRGGEVELNFPCLRASRCAEPAGLAAGLGAKPVEVLKARDYLAVFDSPETVKNLKPNFDELARLDCIGTIATAPGKLGGPDFVSRFFAPAVGVREDPVTGSAHCTLTPFWSERLGKQKLLAHQVSKRSGEIKCEMAGDRVLLSGSAVIYSRGHLEIPD